MNTPTDHAPRPVLIIGYGSEIRGDDALGTLAAAELEQRFEGDDAVRVLGRTSLTPELAADAAEAELVIFIDCSAEGTPGQVVRRDVERIDDATASMVHFLDPPGLLHWSQRLYGRAPRAVILTAGGESFDINPQGLTPRLRDALGQIVDDAEKITRQTLQSVQMA